MKREKIENSSNLAAAGYDPESRTLEVEFKGSAVYRYADVPPEVWQQFQATDAKGAFIARAVKGVFEFVKVPAEEVAAEKAAMAAEPTHGA